MTGIRTALIDLMKETGPAHHRAFEATDGADPEWPLWYAEYTLPRLKALLGEDLTLSVLVYAYVKADKAYQAEKPDAHWTEYYADLLLSEFSS